MKPNKIKEIETIIQSIKKTDLETFLHNEKDFSSCYIMRKTDQNTIFNDVHNHELYEILYISNGSINYTIEGIHYELNEGDLLLIPPLCLHKLDKFLSKESKRYVLNFSRDFSNKLSTKKCDLNKAFEIAFQRKSYKLTFDKPTRKSLEKYFNAMVEYQFENDFGSDLAFNLRFCLAMLLINKAIFNVKDENNIVTSTNTVITEVVEYINNNINKPLLIADLAKRFSLSTSRLSHLFKEETGLSLHQFIIKKRLSFAKQFIRNGEHLNVIYALCGFNDNTSFFRAFKKEFNITPKKYYLSYKLYTD